MAQFKEIMNLKLKQWTSRAVPIEGFTCGVELFLIKVEGRRREKICNLLIIVVAIYLDSYMHLCLLKAIMKS